VRIVLASANAGKLRELSALLSPHGVTLISQGELGIGSVPETGMTFVENALIKARHASTESGLPAIADDSGISVDALGGRPGVHSARFAGEDATDADNNAQLLEELHGIRDARAHYDCVLVFLRSPEDPAPLIATGRWHGFITTEPRGENGFGYDPYFRLPEMQLTAAELPPEEKNRISHRGQAVRSLVGLLGEELDVALDGSGNLKG
jgi:XTP/dITP diphosphohydrolase